MARSRDPMQPFFEHADFLRRLAVQLAGSDAADLLQDTWLAAQRHPTEPAPRLRAWLGTVATNLWRNALRANARRRVREALSGASADGAAPAVIDIVAREELRRRVVTAVLELPENLREVVLLRYYEGLDASAIGARLQRPASTVRTQLQTALQQLRTRLDAEHGGDRAAWAVPLTSLVRSFAPAAAVRSGVALVIAVVLLAVASIAWVAWPVAGDAQLAAGTTSTSAVPIAAATPGADAAIAAERRAAATPQPHAAEHAAYRGDLPIGALAGHVVDGATGTPIAATTVRIRPSTLEASSPVALPAVREDERTLVSDADGAFHIASITAGLYLIEAEGPTGERDRTHIAIGTGTSTATLQLRPHPYAGLALVKVVDAARVAVAGARVELAVTCSQRGPIGYDGVPPIVGITDASGSFRFSDARQLENVEGGFAIATAPDGRCGTLIIGNRVHRGHNPWFEIVVGPPGAIEGRLSGPRTDWSAARIHLQPAWGYDSVRAGMAMARTPIAAAADGTFRIAGVAAGRYHLQVTGVEPLVRVLPSITEGWQNLPAVAVTAAATTAETIQFAASGRLRGVVRDEAGKPLAGALVRASRTTPERATAYQHVWSDSPPDPYGIVSATTDSEGHYALFVAAGIWHLAAVSPGRTLALQLGFEVAAGDTVLRDLQLVADGALRGRAFRSDIVLRRRAEDGSYSPQQYVGSSAGTFGLRGLQPGSGKSAPQATADSAASLKCPYGRTRRRGSTCALPSPTRSSVS